MATHIPDGLLPFNDWLQKLGSVFRAAFSVEDNTPTMHGYMWRAKL